MYLCTHKFKTFTNMTTNKQFNTYKEGLDLEFLREYCMEHGERRVMERGETLEEGGAARLPSVSWRVPGEPAQWVAFVERGCFKYMVHRSATKETLGSSKNDEEGKDYCTGFAFEGEFVSDFPYCLFSLRHAQLPEHHPQGYHVRSEKIAPLSLSSLRLSPSAPDFRALPRLFCAVFRQRLKRNIPNYLGVSKNLTTFAV